MRLVVALVLVVASLGAVQAQPTQWTTWSEDPQEAPVALAGDIAAVRVASQQTLGIAFETHATAGAPPMLGAVASSVAFVARQDDARNVIFSWDGTPRLEVDGAEVTQGWSVDGGSHSGAWVVRMEWAILGVKLSHGFVLADLEAGTTLAGAPVDEATGPDLSFTPGASGLPQVAVLALEAGVTLEGPDFAGGASVTVDAEGRPLVAFYVYDAERGTQQGVYVARVGSGQDLEVERIADLALGRDNGRDGQMRTQVAHDGQSAFVLYTADPAVDNDKDGPGHLGTPDSVRVLVQGPDGWSAEDPTPGGTSDVGPEDVADLVARDARVVAAVPVGRDVWIMERQGPGQWRELARLPAATTAKLALDAQGDVHAAFVVYGDDAMRDGKLYYASSAEGFASTHMGSNIDAGWESPETDGSFAIAVGPSDEVALLWNDGRARERSQEQPYAVLQDGQWRRGFAPLVPSHGNPQYTMRLGYASTGVLVAGSGYGGTDSLAAMASDGSWTKAELPRYDVWDMAVAPSGTTYFAYTQPHGGTTLALSAYGPTHDGGAARTSDLRQEMGAREAAGPGTLAALLLVALVALAARDRGARGGA